MPCELCDSAGGDLLWQNERCRVVLLNDADYPGFCRVIWREHIQEMSDLEFRERSEMMEIVFAVERALRRAMDPVKMNLASLGNVTPHLHWHVIPRFAHDPHFPSPVWSTRRRDSVPAANPGLLGELRTAVEREIAKLARDT